jgi:hypothetical protein
MRSPKKQGVVFLFKNSFFNSFSPQTSKKHLDKYIHDFKKKNSSKNQKINPGETFLVKRNSLTSFNHFGGRNCDQQPLSLSSPKSDDPLSFL